MSYLAITGFGYLFNLICVIILGIALRVHKVNLIYLNKLNDELNAKQNEVISKSINPFRSKDFIFFLPYGYGLQVLTYAFKSKSNLTKRLAYDVKEKYEYLTKIEKEHDENTKDI